jgi:hypothetical protein
MQPFATHMRTLKWEQGDHVLLSAPTKAGKTTLASKLISKRSHAVIFVTKMKDPTFQSEFRDWTRFYQWKDIRPYHTRVLLWPKPGKTIRETLAIQRETFAYALDAIAREGNRAVIVDEALMFTDPKILGFGTEVGMMHYYGRSSGISMMTLTQRPAWIPKVIYSSVTHAYVARTRDKGDLKRLSDMGGIDPREVATSITQLPTRHDYLYLNPQGDASPVVVNSRK